MTARPWPAGLVAAGWLSVTLACAQDRDHPLYRQLLVEGYPDGIRLVATDRQMLLRSWLAVDFAEQPVRATLPDWSAVVTDRNHRGRGLMRHLLALTRAAVRDEEPQPWVRVALAEEPDQPDQPTLAGLEQSWLVIELGGEERLRMPARSPDGYPDWRLIEDGWRPATTGGLVVDPLVLARLGELGRYHTSQVAWTLGVTSARVHLPLAEPSVGGLAITAAPGVHDVAGGLLSRVIPDVEAG